ncbi:MAG: hypothetical protein R3C03_19550 [Pirellulaceae bacterium]
MIVHAFSIFALLLIFSFGGQGQEEIDEDFLIEKLGASLKICSTIKFVRVQGETNGADKNETVVAVGGNNGSSVLTGDRNLVCGFNEKYAFRLIKGSVDQKDWQILKVAFRGNDQKDYDELKGLVVLDQAGLAPYLNLLNEHSLLQLLKDRSIQIKSQNRLATGAIEVSFEATPEVLEKIKAHDAKQKEYDAKALVATSVDELPEKPGARPTHMLSSTYVLEPNFGYLISSFDQTTSHRKKDAGVEQELVFKCKHGTFELVDDLYYPAKLEFQRSIGSFEETASVSVLDVNTELPSEWIDSGYLSYFGLPEPDLDEGNEFEGQSPSANTSSNGYTVRNVTIILAGLLVATLAIRGLKKRNSST